MKGPRSGDLVKNLLSLALSGEIPVKTIGEYSKQVGIEIRNFGITEFLHCAQNLRKEHLPRSRW